MYFKNKMLKNLENKPSYSYRYRVHVGDEYRYFRFVVRLSDDKKHFVLGDIDIEDTMTAKSQEIDKSKSQVTFTRIAETLASNYDAIYYVEVKTGNYDGFTADKLYGDLQVARSGEDFFTETMNNIMMIVHPQDREYMLDSLDKDKLLSSLEGMKRIVLEYRLIIDDKVEHTRLIARNTSDGEHIIVCVENIEKEVEKEKEHLKALQTEKELARRDELTGTKNKTAFAELEKSVQGNIEGGLDYLPFGFAVCDINDLKKVNDTQGHKAGDEYIKASAKLLCDTFVHSPVFRIGGDEFVIFLRSDDYTNRRKLIADLKQTVINNQKSGQGPVIAIGTADYNQDTDSNVNDVFERADEAMYENKRWLKGGDVR
jgi:diguanylate cyclase (GGDEF)-like protein